LTVQAALLLCPSAKLDAAAGRADGRAPREARALRVRLGVNPSAAGSAWVELGATKVAASVFGPHENARAEGDAVASGALDVTLQFAPFASCAPPGGRGAVADAERRAGAALDAALAPAVLLRRFPKAVVEVAVLVLESDGGELPAAVAAAAAALVDAGVELADVPCGACVAGVARAGGGGSGGGGVELLVDPTAAEVAAAVFTTSVAFLPGARALASATHSGAAPGGALADALALAMAAADALGGELRRELLAATAARTTELRAAQEGAAAAAGGVAAR